MMLVMMKIKKRTFSKMEISPNHSVDDPCWRLGGMRTAFPFPSNSHPCLHVGSFFSSLVFHLGYSKWLFLSGNDYIFFSCFFLDFGPVGIGVKRCLCACMVAHRSRALLLPLEKQKQKISSSSCQGMGHYLSFMLFSLHFFSPIASKEVYSTIPYPLFLSLFPFSFANKSPSLFHSHTTPSPPPPLSLPSLSLSFSRTV